MKTILFAEDTEELRELMVGALKQAGFNVIEAKNGMEALRLFRANPEIQAVLTDLEMPMMNGIQLVHSIRELNTLVPIVMWSGAIDPKISSISFLAKDSGAKTVVAKLNEKLNRPLSEIVGDLMKRSA